MWSALPLALGAISSVPNRQLVAVGRHQTGTGEGGDAEQRLSGSDVLTALQRAAANKSKEKACTNDNISAAAAAAARGNEQSSAVIKPLRIDPQWPHQLHHLETRLHQLPHL